VAKSIPGSEVTIMKGLGHFPMSENPQEFLKHLLPVLEKIKGRS
jgi:pimeloyl-ACP methyl ester carboxylesterase